MNRIFFAVFVVGLWSLSGPWAGSTDKDKPKQQTQLADVLRRSADELVLYFDKNQDGYLTRDEVPFFSEAAFDRLDVNHDKKLDTKEMERALQTLRAMDEKEINKVYLAIRERAAAAKETKPEIGGGEVAKWLQTLDKNKDGKISRQEAQGRLRESFTVIDANKDGFLEKKELQSAALRMLAAQPKAAPKARPPAPSGPPPDFDTVDQDADGRISRQELQATPYRQHFDEIDANKDGKISPKEWDAFVKKMSEAKEKLTGKN